MAPAVHVVGAAPRRGRGASARSRIGAWLKWSSALTKLPVDQRELILLMRENDWSYGDLARITGVTATAVKSRLFRARSRLRALMNGDES